MEAELIESAGKISGLAGIAFAIVFLLWRELIKKLDWPKPRRDQAFILLKKLILYSFILAIAGCFFWVLSLVIKIPFGAASETVENGGNATIELNFGSSSNSTFDYNSGDRQIEKVDHNHIMFLAYKHLKSKPAMTLQNLAKFVLKDFAVSVNPPIHSVSKSNQKEIEKYIGTYIFSKSLVNLSWKNQQPRFKLSGEFNVRVTYDGDTLDSSTGEEIRTALLSEGLLIITNPKIKLTNLSLGVSPQYFVDSLFVFRNNEELFKIIQENEDSDSTMTTFFLESFIRNLKKDSIIRLVDPNSFHEIEYMLIEQVVNESESIWILKEI